MRHQLEPYVDQFVLVTGFSEERKQADLQVKRLVSDFWEEAVVFDDVCVKAARVSRFDLDLSGDANLDELDYGTAASADHLWLRVPRNQKFQQWSKLNFTGYCTRYKRSNGTEDIGIEWIPLLSAVDLFKRVYKFWDKKNYGQANEVIATSFKAIKEGPIAGIFWASNLSHNQIEAELRKLRKRNTRYYQEQQRQLAEREQRRRRRKAPSTKGFA